jgi:hypothetical protein
MYKFTFLVFILFAFGSVSAYGQTGTSSPYSISGMGELKYVGFVDHQLMGGTSRSFQGENNYSIKNPASYAFLKSTVYSAGAFVTNGTLDDGITTADAHNGNMNYFALAFASPYERKINWGLSMGFYKLTDIGYEIKATNQDTFNSYNIFKGTGGMNTFYFGAGVEPIKNLSLGLNVNYNFGSVQDVEAQIIPVKSHFSFSDERYTYYKGFNIDLGVQYSIQSEKLRHTLGATFHTSSKLNGKGYRHVESFFGTLFDQGSLVGIDTILFEDNLTSEKTMPASYGFGYSLSNQDQWTLSLEYENGLWSNITNPLDGEPYRNNVRYGMGYSFVPKPDYTTSGQYFNKVRYMVGVQYEDLFYNFFDEPITQLGISFGLGLPVVRIFQSRTGKVPMVNRINLGVEYQTRGNLESNLIKEEYISFRVGLNFNDKWFLKRKYQ